MQTITEVVDSSQEVFLQALRKQAPRRGISTVGASSPPPIARIRDVRGITLSAKCALFALYAREPNIFPGMELLAADMGTSVWTARRAVRELERAGYVLVTPRIGQTNLYSLTVAGAPPPVTHDTPPQVTHDTPPLAPMTPPPSTGATPPLAPVLPEVAIEVFKISNKRERESTLSPGNQSSKETITCPQCEHSWTANFGSICHTCNMEVSTIKRNIEERKSQDEAAEAAQAERQKREDANIKKELETIRQNQDAQRAAAETFTQNQRAEKSPGEVEAEAKSAAGHQANRKKLFDLTPGKQYDKHILAFFPARAC